MGERSSRAAKAANVTVASEPAHAASRRTAGEVRFTVETSEQGGRMVISVDAGGGPGPAVHAVARWHVGADGKILSSNVDEIILGLRWKSDQLPWHAVHPDDRARVYAEWQSILARRARFAFRFRMQRVSGEYVGVLSRGEPVICGEEFCGFSGTVERCS